MRPLATWLVVGGLALLGLFAARDALRSDAAPASSAGPTSSLEKRRHTPPAVVGLPQIAGKSRLAAELQALGAGGVLHLTVADCGRYLLGLPALLWTTAEELSGPECGDIPNSVVDTRVGIGARQVGAETIEASAEGWHLRFQGTSPAFTPAGTLTFLRDGRLYQWTVRCPPGSQTVTFRGLHTLDRCPRVVDGAPRQLRELVWVSGHDFAAIAGQEYYSTLLVVRDGRPSTVFRSIGARMGSLEASSAGRYLAVRVDGNLAVFDTRSGDPVPVPRGSGQAAAVAWSPDERFAALASETGVYVYPARRPAEAVALPLSAVALDWR